MINLTLKTRNLSRNNLEGNIPKEFSLLTDLTSLFVDIEFNQNNVPILVLVV